MGLLWDGTEVHIDLPASLGAQKPESPASTHSPCTCTPASLGYLGYHTSSGFDAISPTICENRTNSFTYSALLIYQHAGEEALCTRPDGSVHH